MTDRPRRNGGAVVPIPRGADTPEPDAPLPSPARGLHRIAIAGAAICAFVAIASGLAFITIRWPGATSRYLVGTLLFSVVGFVASAAIAVLSAARATYRQTRSRQRESGGGHGESGRDG